METEQKVVPTKPPDWTQLNRHTLAALQGNETAQTFGAQEGAGKYYGGIYVIDAKDRPRLMVTTSPAYNTEAEAIAVVTSLLEEVSKLPKVFSAEFDALVESQKPSWEAWDREECSKE